MKQKQDAKPLPDPSGRPSLRKFNLFRSYNETLFPREGRMTPRPFLQPLHPLHTNNNAANVSVPGWGGGTAPAAHKNRSRRRPPSTIHPPQRPLRALPPPTPSPPRATAELGRAPPRPPPGWPPRRPRVKRG